MPIVTAMMRCRGYAIVLAGLVILTGCGAEKSTVADGAAVSTACRSAPSTAGCEDTVRRLNDALDAALQEVLPAGAAVSSNMVLMDQPEFDRVTFFPARDSDGADGYDAAMRVRVGDRVGILEIMVHPSSAIPESDDCPDQARLDEMASKGMKQLRCDRHDADGAVVVVHVGSEPYGSGEFADMALQNLLVTAYRGDAVKVNVSLSPNVSRVPDDPAARQAVTENILRLEQLEKLALDSAFTLP